MMKKVLTLLIVLMISLSLSACCPPVPEPKIIIEQVYHYTACPKDETPNYVQLNPTKHVGSAENVNALIGNLEIMKDYNKSLNTTIECYEKQVRKSNDQN